MSLSINKKYVPGKVRCIKWQPKLSFDRTDTFLTGTWDDEENWLSLWQLPEIDGDPIVRQEISFSCNINAIQYVTEDAAAVGLGNGNIVLYQHSPSYQLSCKTTWNNSHTVCKAPVPCTALASCDSQIASVGEDGHLIIFCPELTEPIRNIESGGNCSDLAVTFVKTSEVLTANMQGHLRLWDLRSDNSAISSLLSPDQVSIHHIASHPTQQHLVAAGNEIGDVIFWDMRNAKEPLFVISAHNGLISEVQFHPIQNNHLFTCSYDGQVIHWDATSSSKSSLLSSRSTKGFDKASLKNAWLSSNISKGIVDTVSIIPKSVLPVNSISIVSDILIAGSDEEAVYLAQNVMA